MVRLGCLDYSCLIVCLTLCCDYLWLCFALAFVLLWLGLFVFWCVGFVYVWFASRLVVFVIALFVW